MCSSPDFFQIDECHRYFRKLGRHFDCIRDQISQWLTLQKFVELKSRKQHWPHYCEDDSFVPQKNTICIDSDHLVPNVASVIISVMWIVQYVTKSVVNEKYNNTTFLRSVILYCIKFANKARNVIRNLKISLNFLWLFYKLTNYQLTRFRK